MLRWIASDVRRSSSAGLNCRYSVPARRSGCGPPARRTRRRPEHLVVVVEAERQAALEHVAPVRAVAVVARQSLHQRRAVDVDLEGRDVDRPAVDVGVAVFTGPWSVKARVSFENVGMRSKLGAGRAAGMRRSTHLRAWRRRIRLSLELANLQRARAGGVGGGVRRHGRDDGAAARARGAVLLDRARAGRVQPERVAQLGPPAARVGPAAGAAGRLRLAARRRQRARGRARTRRCRSRSTAGWAGGSCRPSGCSTTCTTRATCPGTTSASGAST